MLSRRDCEVLLSFEPLVLERCYLVADVLHDDFGEPYMEYALLGLAAESNPFHVLATPLLVGQSVTPASVEQPGRQVFRMRREMEILSNRMRQRLVPIVFIHRHSSCCEASATDDAFLRGVFVDQVSTVVSFEEARLIDASDLQCGCPGMQRLIWESATNGKGPVELRSEYGMAFSLIVNRERDHRLYAVRKSTCPLCGQAEVRYVPARLAPEPSRPVSALDRALMRRRLGEEIKAKVNFQHHGDCTESIQ